MNTAMQTNQLVKGSGNKPMQVNGSRDLTGDIYIARREFLGNVYASATGTTNPNGTTPIQSQFNVNTYNINAGLSTSYPWLSQVAKNFTFYEFEGLIYEYKPLSGEFGNLNTNALGKVVMATQYDPDAPNFTSSTQMENYDYATSCKPAEHMLHGVETKVRQRTVNMLYVRTGQTGKDEVLTDVGDFQIATEGVPLTLPALTAQLYTATQAIGELWVTYKCKLSRANIYATVNNAPSDFHLTAGTSGSAYGNNTTGTQNLFQALQIRLYNTQFNTQPNYFSPKLTNTLGTTVLGIIGANSGTSSATANTCIAVIWPPGSSGSFQVTFQLQCTTAPTAAFQIKPISNAADFATILASNYQVPSGVLGVATGLPVTQAVLLNAFPGSTTGVIASGFGSGITSSQTVNALGVGNNSSTAFVSFASTASQIPYFVWQCGAALASGGYQASVAIVPTILNSTN